MTDLAKMKLDEWLEADGLGGFASGTVSGIRTRRYHALEKAKRSSRVIPGSPIGVATPLSRSVVCALPPTVWTTRVTFFWNGRASSRKECCPTAFPTWAMSPNITPSMPRSGTSSRFTTWGTVWPWLIGAFVEAWLRVRAGTLDAKGQARQRFLSPMMEHLDSAGLGHVSEIADADPPHTARGCSFQAWSLGELLWLNRVVLADAAMARKSCIEPA
jgi:glycogen debranching enzyme